MTDTNITPLYSHGDWESSQVYPPVEFVTQEQYQEMVARQSEQDVRLNRLAAAIVSTQEHSNMLTGQINQIKEFMRSITGGLEQLNTAATVLKKKFKGSGIILATNDDREFIDAL